MTSNEPMRAAEIARRMGVSLDVFYRRREQYRMIDGMPAPLSRVGRPKWDRAGMEIWLTRFDPRRPQHLVAANDTEASLVPDPAADEEHRARLRRAYAPQTSDPTLDSARERAGG
ncbi:hypothetical protein ACWX0K_10805 [Nitrobacteraceae bacterium UC4446_H13]